jgi:hypothetical protein
MDERETPLGKLLRNLAPRTRELAGRRADPAFLTALALDVLLGLKERHRVQVLRVSTTTADITGRGSQAKQRPEGQTEAYELALHGDT